MSSIVSQKNSPYTATIHPLVILSISDHIARATLRATGSAASSPIAGLLLGSIDEEKKIFEVVKSYYVAVGMEGGVPRVPEQVGAWGDLDPYLKILGYYTLAPEVGLTEALLPLHNAIVGSPIQFPSTPLLLAFHPQTTLSPPLTLYTPISMPPSTFSPLPPPALTGPPASTTALTSLIHTAHPAATATTSTTPPTHRPLTTLHTKATAVQSLLSTLCLLHASITTPPPTLHTITHNRELLALVTSLGLTTPSDVDSLQKELDKVGGESRIAGVVGEMLGAAGEVRKAGRMVGVVGTLGVAGMGKGMKKGDVMKA